MLYPFSYILYTKSKKYEDKKEHPYYICESVLNRKVYFKQMHKKPSFKVQKEEYKYINGIIVNLCTTNYWK